jgi:hypothetical protein
MDPLSEGQYVKHEKYGLGVVLESDSERTSIDFHIHGPKKFSTSLMNVELTNEAPPPKPAKRRAPRRKSEEASPRKLIATGPEKVLTQVAPFTISVVGRTVR